MMTTEMDKVDVDEIACGQTVLDALSVPTDTDCGSDPRDENSIPMTIGTVMEYATAKTICPIDPNPEQEDMDLNGEGDCL